MPSEWQPNCTQSFCCKTWAHTATLHQREELWWLLKMVHRTQHHLTSHCSHGSNRQTHPKQGKTLQTSPSTHNGSLETSSGQIYPKAIVMVIDRPLRVSLKRWVRSSTTHSAITQNGMGKTGKTTMNTRAATLHPIWTKSQTWCMSGDGMSTPPLMTPPRQTPTYHYISSKCIGEEARKRNTWSDKYEITARTHRTERRHEDAIAPTKGFIK